MLGGTMLVDINLIHVPPTAGWREDAEESIPPAQGQLPSPSQCFACAGEAGAASAAPHHPQPRCGRGHGWAGSPLLGHGTGSLLGHEAALPYPCCIFQTARPFFHCPWNGTEQKAGEKCKMVVGVRTGVSFGVAQGVLNRVGSMVHRLLSLWEHNQ